MRIFVPSAATLLTDRAGHGEGLIAWNVFAGLARRGHELVVCAPRISLSAEPPFETIELGPGSPLESLAPLGYARAAARAGRRTRADVWHWLFPQLPEHVALVRPSDAPLVVGPWSLRWPGGSRRPRRAGDAIRLALQPFLRARNRRALDGAAHLLFSTPAALEQLGGGRRSARVVPFGVDADSFRAAPVPPGGPVLFVGRLDEPKGALDLVEAFALVRAELPEAHLVVAGDGPARAALEERGRRLGLDGSLELLGPVEPGRVPELLAEASLFCAPSHGEPYGMAVLEAMAAGRAVVATDAGGPRFLVGGDGGRLVPVADPRALAAALLDLLAAPAELEAIGRANRERVERELSLERMLDRLEELYAEAAR